MSKKQKRNVSSGPRRVAPEAVDQTETPTPQVSPSSTYSAPRSTAPASRRFAAVAEFKPDYTHVVGDLKRIGIIAASFFVILVVLSFILK